MTALAIANKMIDVYLHTPIEKYPEARAIDVLDDYPFGSYERQQAFNLFLSWIDMREQ